MSYKYIERKLCYIAVDFFFILSGFFFAKTLTIETSVYKFMQHKFYRLWPVLAFTVVINICYLLYGFRYSVNNFSDIILTLFFLNDVGLSNNSTGPAWFVSVLFFSLVFYFILYKNSRRLTTTFSSANIITFVLIFFCYGCITQKYNGNLDLYKQYGSILRGVAGLGVGIFLYNFYATHFPKISISAKAFILYSCFELLLLSWILYTMLFCPKNWLNNYIFIIAFCALISLFLLKQGLLSQVLNNKFSTVLGRYSYSIFLTHELVLFYISGAKLVSDDFIKNNLFILLGVIYFAVILLAIAVYHIIENPKNKLYAKLGFIKYYTVMFLLAALIFFASTLIL